MTNAGQLRVISSSSSLFLNINSYRVLGFLCGALPFPCVSVFDPSPLLNRYLPQGDHVPGWQSVQPTTGAGVLQEQPQPLLPLHPGGPALRPCFYKGWSNCMSTVLLSRWKEMEKWWDVFGGGRARVGNYAWAKMSHSRKSLNVSRLGSYRDCYCVYVSVCVSMYVYVRERQITTDCVCWCFQSAVSVLLRDSLHSIPLPSPTEDRFTSLPASLVLLSSCLSCSCEKTNKQKRLL